MSAINRSSRARLALVPVAMALVTACGGDKQAASSDSAVPAADPSGSVQPAPGGRMIEIEMFSNEKGSYYEPKEITAKPGDVLHFELMVGVHNVNFLPDSNAGKTGLPAPTMMLQIPHQIEEIPVTLAPGSYYFQCDPHAALGMVGRLIVTK